MTFKQCKVVLLPTDKAENSIIIHNTTKKKAVYHGNNYFTQEYLRVCNSKAYHLYILSDDKIESSGWVMYENGTIERVSVMMVKDVKYKQIIVSTDPQIHNLPKLPESFIEYFIEQYNKSNVITEIKVKYGYTINKSMGHFHQYREYFLKVNDDNIINIQPIKDSWSRDEVIIFAKAYAEAVWNIRHDNGSAFFDTLEKKWIEQNLK